MNSNYSASSPDSTGSHPSQQDQGIPAADAGLVEFLAEAQQAALFDVVDAQPGLLVLDPVVDVGHLQAAGGVVQHLAHAPVAVEVQRGARQLGRGAGRLRLDVQVDAFVRGQVGVALGVALEGVERGQLGRRGRRFGLGFERVLFLPRPGLQPGEAQPYFLCVARGLAQRAAAQPRPQRRQVGAVVRLPEPVPQAVVAVAIWAVHGLVLRSVDEGLAGGFGTLGRRGQGGFLAQRSRGGRQSLVDAVFPPVAGPFTGMGAFVGRLGPVLETVGVVAGVAAEGEEVELVTVGKLTVAADGVEVGGVHGSVGFFGVICRGRRGGHGRRWGGFNSL